MSIISTENTGDLLRIKDLEVEFHSLGGVTKALKGISFRVRPASTLALVGESGSGKSVTAQAILGLLPRTAKITGGQILLNDPVAGPLDLTALNPRSKRFAALRGNCISMIFQEPMTSLSPLHTIGDQIGETQIIHKGASRAQARELTIDMLRLVGFANPTDAFNTYAFELSGGLRQRAMIAMALLCGPSLLIADEPTTALDVTVQAQILSLIKDLQGELGMAVLMITHDLGVVANVADEVVVVYRGQVMESGTLDDIFERPQHPYLRALLNAIPRFGMKSSERLKPIREIKACTDGLTTFTRTSQPKTAGSPLLDIRNISKSFSIRKKLRLLGKAPAATIHALSDVSLCVQRGKCLGLVGESGCGKTTLSKIITRAMCADSGEVIFNGADVPVDLLTLNARQMEPIRRKIQYVFQDPYSALNPRMSIGDSLIEPLLIHGIGTKASRRDTVLELTHLVGLQPKHLNRYPHSFSGGQRQRIVIARALTLSPELLICDEPVSALDVSIQAQILNLLKDLQRDLGLSYLFISHNLAVVDYIADTIAVMCAGYVVEIAPRDILFKSPLHPYTKALISAVPCPDPKRPLDFSALADGRHSDPGEWAFPFGKHQHTQPRLIQIGGDHFVRAHEPPKRESAYA